MTCKNCGKEIESVASLCPECEALAVAAADVKKAKMFGFVGALFAAVGGAFAIFFAVFAILAASVTGAWLGYAIFAVVLTALAFMVGGSSVVVYIERRNNEVKPFITFILGLVAMSLAAIAAILFIVSLILVFVA